MNIDQILGIVAFGVSGLAAGLCAWRLGSGRASWSLIAFLNLAICLELATTNRFELSAWLKEAWAADLSRDERRSFQAEVIAWSGSVFAILFVIWLWRLRTLALRLAAVASVGGLVLVGLEVVSLHSIDAVLYTRRTGLLVIVWAWGGSGAITTLAALGALIRNLERDDRG
ncbi:MAG: hypothetical protein AAGH74_05460 [Pseudomonadota bacterium]